MCDCLAELPHLALTRNTRCSLLLNAQPHGGLHPTHGGLGTLGAGTYNPVMKMVYAEDAPLDAPTLTAIRTFLAASALGIAVLSSRASQPQLQQRREDSNGRGFPAGDDDQDELPTASAQSVQPDGMPPLSLPLLGVAAGVAATDRGSSSGSSSSSSSSRGIGLLSAASGSVLVAGLELGLYNFAGTALQALGLQLTSATRAGFIIQSTAILTPAISYLAVSD